MTIKVIVPRSNAEKYYAREYVNMLADTAKPLTTIFGIDIFTTNEDIKEVIMFDLDDAVHAVSEGGGK